MYIHICTYVRTYIHIGAYKLYPCLSMYPITPEFTHVEWLFEYGFLDVLYSNMCKLFKKHDLFKNDAP